MSVNGLPVDDPRRVPLERWPEALERHPGDVKVVIDFPGTPRDPHSARRHA